MGGGATIDAGIGLIIVSGDAVDGEVEGDDEGIADFVGDVEGIAVFVGELVVVGGRVMLSPLLVGKKVGFGMFLGKFEKRILLLLSLPS